MVGFASELRLGHDTVGVLLEELDALFRLEAEVLDRLNHRVENLQLQINVGHAHGAIRARVNHLVC